MGTKTRADGEHALSLFQFAKSAIQQASQRERAGFRGLQRFGHVFRLTRGNDGLHRLWSGNRDQSCARSQGRASGKDGRAAFSHRTGEKQHVAVGSLVRIGCADQRERCKFVRSSPAEVTVSEFFDQIWRRANGNDFQDTARRRVGRN